MGAFWTSGFWGRSTDGRTAGLQGVYGRLVSGRRRQERRTGRRWGRERGEEVVFSSVVVGVEGSRPE